MHPILDQCMKRLALTLILAMISHVIVVTRKHKLIYPFPPTFFGLDDEYVENTYEQFFVLKYHGGWSFIEAYNLPIQLREWYVRRLAKQLEDEKEQMEKSMGNSRSR